MDIFYTIKDYENEYQRLQAMLPVFDYRYQVFLTEKKPNWYRWKRAGIEPYYAVRFYICRIPLKKAIIISKYFSLDTIFSRPFVFVIRQDDLIAIDFVKLKLPRGVAGALHKKESTLIKKIRKFYGLTRETPMLFDNLFPTTR